MHISEPLVEYVADDGLYMGRPVGAWAEEKYGLLKFYDSIFATGMKKVWEKRIYVDLFAGAGIVRIRKTNRVRLASPLLALGVPDRFDRYIFCDEDRKSIEALRKRVEARFPEADVRYFVGDANSTIDDVCETISDFKTSYRTLTFGFVDPYSLAIEFSIIKKLSSFYIDFLILFAFGMDGNRNVATYIEQNHQRIERFLNSSSWRDRWRIAEAQGVSFTLFLAREFASQMIDLRYLDECVRTMIAVRSNDKNLPLYHLGFFSRDQLGYKFWKEAQKYHSQPSLFIT